MSGRSMSATAPLVRPIRARSLRTSVRPLSLPSTSTSPCDGASHSEAIRIRVVLPEPLGPRTIQRWPSLTSQSMGPSTLVPSMTRSTPRSAMTGRAGAVGAAVCAMAPT